MGTAERRLEIMKLLCKERYMKMIDLAEMFSVSVRTIQRDIEELTFIIPLYAKSGRYDGGVYVKEGYTMDRMYMTPQQTELLIKVKDIAKDKLSEKENKLFEYIIKSYTLPILKKF